MRRSIALAVVLLLAVLLCSGCDSGPRIAPLGGDGVVLAFGDSLTFGTGAPAGQAYPDILSDLLGRPVVNAGIPGEISAAGLKRLPGMLDRHQPRLVILCHGGNDFLRRLDQDGTARNLKQMVALIRDHGADVVLIGVPKLGFGLAVPKFYAAIAEEYAIPFEGDILVALLGDRAMKSDAIHPNASGYRLLAEAIGTLIRKASR
jgi:lysophospholipase L1-like esterase